MKKFTLATILLFGGLAVAQNTGNWVTDYGPVESPEDDSTVLFQVPPFTPGNQKVGTWKGFKDDFDYAADGTGILPVASGGTGQASLTNLINSLGLQTGSVTPPKLSDDDFGDFTVLAGNATLDNDTVGSDEIASTAVTPGVYTNANLTVDADGRVTAASNGAASGSGDILEGEFGGISVEGNATTTTFGGSSTDFSNKAQVTVFDTDGASSSNTTPAHGTDDITVGVDGPYLISANVSFSGGSSDTYSFAFFIDNGATQIGPRFTVVLDSSGGVASASLAAIANLTDTDTVELWCQNEDDTSALTVQDANLGIASVPGFDPNLVEASTFGDGSEASFAWTFDLSGAVDPILTFSDDEIATNGDFEVGGDLTVIGSSTFDSLTVTNDLEAGGLLYDDGANDVRIDLPPGTDRLWHDTNSDGVKDAGENFIDYVFEGVIDNYDFDTDQTVGAGQDNYVLTYDDADGQISLEPAGASSFDSTAVDSKTWSDGTQASIVDTYNVSGTDHTVTYGDGEVTYSHDVTVDGALTVDGQISKPSGEMTLFAPGDKVNVGTAAVAQGQGIRAYDGGSDNEVGHLTLFDDGGNGYTIFFSSAGELRVVAADGVTDDDTDGAAILSGQITTSEIAAATLVTEADDIASNDNDTTVPTSAAVKDYADSVAARQETFVLTIDDVADSMDYAIGFVDAAFTISEVRAVHAGTGLSTPDIDIDVRHGTDRSAAGSQLETTAMAITSSSTGNSFTSGFEDATVVADSWIWIETSSQSGTTDNLEIIVIGTYD